MPRDEERRRRADSKETAMIGTNEMVRELVQRPAGEVPSRMSKRNKTLAKRKEKKSG